jgi:hypothetical protein
VQKVEFVNQDLDADAAPAETELVRFYTAHSARYLAPATASFTQLYFSPDSEGDAAARTRALRALALLERGASNDALGSADTFVDGADFAAMSAANAERLFGNTPVSAALFKAPIGHWAGPFKSGYGWHVVRVTAREASRPEDFATVRSRVLTDYLADARDRRNNAEFRRLASKYHIVTDGSPT